MARRRLNNRRKAKQTHALTRIEIRDVRNLIITSLLVLAGLYGMRVIADVPIKKVMVNNRFEHIDKGEIKDIVGKYYTQGFFTISLNEFETELEDLEWVYQANIQRKWPNTLLVNIEEQTPVFRWAEQSLLNKEAAPFFVTDNQHFAYLPKLKGPLGREIFLSKLYVKYNPLFKQLGLTIKSIEEDARYDKLIRLSNGIEINIGKEKVEDKLQRCLRSFAEFNANEIASIASIDLRHSNGFAVQWDT